MLGSSRVRFAKRLNEWSVSGWVIMNKQNEGLFRESRLKAEKNLGRSRHTSLGEWELSKEQQCKSCDAFNVK